MARPPDASAPARRTERTSEHHHRAARDRAHRSQPRDDPGLPGAVPKLFLTNSSWEYWRGDGALAHIDPRTGEDLPDDPDARVFLLRGTDHFGAMTLKRFMPAANPTHTHDVGPILRALFADKSAYAIVDPAAEPVFPYVQTAIAAYA